LIAFGKLGCFFGRKVKIYITAATSDCLAANNWLLRPENKVQFWGEFHH